MTAVACFGIVAGLSRILIETQSFGQVVLARSALALPVLLIAIHQRNWKNLYINSASRCNAVPCHFLICNSPLAY